MAASAAMQNPPPSAAMQHPPAGGNPMVLDLAGILCRQQQPQLGSPEMPTVGSAGHHLRQCKPCAFLYKGQGCENGVQCAFCHLCEPGEKKNRRKEKKIMVQARRAGVPMSMVTGFRQMFA